LKTHESTTASPTLILCLTWLSALVLAMGTTGCLIIPTPHFDSGYARTNLNPAALEQLVPAGSTVEEVMLTLGEPDAVSADEHQLAYRAEKVIAIWIVVIAGGGSGYVGGGEIPSERYYVFEFDSQGRLEKTIQQHSTPELDSASSIEDNTNRVPVSIAGERLWRSYPHSFWFPGVNGFRDRGAANMFGTPGRLLLTESNLYFFSNLRFANAEPTVKVPLSSVLETRMDKHLLADNYCLGGGWWSTSNRTKSSPSKSARPAVGITTRQLCDRSANSCDPGPGRLQRRVDTGEASTLNFSVSQSPFLSN
jgi:hypothetical protein